MAWGPSNCHDKYEGGSSKACGATDQRQPSGDSLWWLQPLEDIPPSSSKTHFLFQFLLVLSVSCQDTGLHANPGTPAGRLCTWRNSGSRTPSQGDRLCPVKFCLTLLQVGSLLQTQRPKDNKPQLTQTIAKRRWASLLKKFLILKLDTCKFSPH